MDDISPDTPTLPKDWIPSVQKFINALPQKDSPLFQLQTFLLSELQTHYEKNEKEYLQKHPQFKHLSKHLTNRDALLLNGLLIKELDSIAQSMVMKRILERCTKGKGWRDVSEWLVLCVEYFCQKGERYKLFGQRGLVQAVIGIKSTSDAPKNNSTAAKGNASATPQKEWEKLPNALKRQLLLITSQDLLKSNFQKLLALLKQHLHAPPTILKNGKKSFKVQQQCLYYLKEILTKVQEGEKSVLLLMMETFFHSDKKVNEKAFLYLSQFVSSTLRKSFEVIQKSISDTNMTEKLKKQRIMFQKFILQSLKELVIQYLHKGERGRNVYHCLLFIAQLEYSKYDSQFALEVCQFSFEVLDLLKQDNMEKLSNVLMTILYRTLPFAKEYKALEERMNQLFKLVHQSSQISTSIRAIQLLSLLCEKEKRYGRALYALLKHVFNTEVKLFSVLVEVVQKYIYGSSEIDGIYAITRICLRYVGTNTTGSGGESVALLLALMNCFYHRKELLQIILKEQSCEFDDQNRSMEFSNASKSVLFELQLLKRHFHPTLRHYAETFYNAFLKGHFDKQFSQVLLKHSVNDSGGEVLLNSSVWIQSQGLAAFLDKFCFKQPKKTVGEEMPISLQSGVQSQAWQSAVGLTTTSGTGSECPLDEVFLKEYFVETGKVLKTKETAEIGDLDEAEIEKALLGSLGQEMEDISDDDLLEEELEDDEEPVDDLEEDFEDLEENKLEEDTEEDGSEIEELDNMSDIDDTNEDDKKELGGGLFAEMDDYKALIEQEPNHDDAYWEQERIQTSQVKRQRENKKLPLNKKQKKF